MALAKYIVIRYIYMDSSNDLSPGEYRHLAEFRRQIRQFLHFSELTAREQGLEAQQHQFLLAVHGLPEDAHPTIREIASRLFIQHHSAVELADRLEHLGVITRHAGERDRREVWIRLAPRGRAMLRRLALTHREELERSGPALARTLKSVLLHGRREQAS